MKTDILPANYLLAIEASIEASKVILRIYQEDIQPTIKSDGSPVTKADLASSKLIAEMLAPTGIPILGEELEKLDYESRKKWTENWCVDPLDGTKMFLLKNDEFSVNIAHVVNGKSVFGVLASPTNREVLIGGPEYGVYILQFDDLHAPEKWEKFGPVTQVNDPLVVTCSHSFSSHQEEKLKEITDIEHRTISYLRKGSAIKFFDIIRGKADIYPRFAPTMEWDIAAGQAILETVGGTIIDANTGQSLTYNKESLYNPHFIARTKALL